MSKKKELDAIHRALLAELRWTQQQLKALPKNDVDAYNAIRKRLLVVQDRILQVKREKLKLKEQRSIRVAELFVEEVRGCISDSLHDFCMQEAIKKYEQESEDGLDRTGL